MKFIFYFFLFSLLACSNNISPEAYYEACPHELKYGQAHYLEVPITMTPHKKQFHVGDTLTVSMMFSDSIFDLSRETSFKIENFPFEPVTLLYKINNDSFESGLELNELVIDEKYNPRYNYRNTQASDFRAHSIYKEGRYSFEFKFVLQTPGKYFTAITDQYQENSDGGNKGLNKKTNKLQFDGRCPHGNFYICSVIQGDNHQNDFLDELIFLDKKVYNDKLARIENREAEHFGKGNIPIDWTGMFGFEVIE